MLCQLSESVNVNKNRVKLLAFQLLKFSIRKNPLQAY